MTDRILDLWLSGETARWHCNPIFARIGQNLADHQGRCAQLVWALWPDASRDLIWAALHHDVGEYRVGDLALHFKRTGPPEVIAAHKAAEAEAMADICPVPMPHLSVMDRKRLEFVDRLESLIFARIHAPAEYERQASGWLADAARLWPAAIVLGVEPAFEALMNRLGKGEW